MSGSRGILTSADKAWLKGETDYEHRQTEAKRRQEIRERVVNALNDFSILNKHWSSEERQKALSGPELEEAATDIIEFLYISLNEPATNAETMTDNSAPARALSFRRALSQGIEAGKRHFGETPESVLIDSNTELFEVPSEEDLRRAIDTGQWRDANKYVSGAIGTDDDSVIDKDEAAGNYHMELHLAIYRELYLRRQRTSSEIKRHEDHVGSTGLLDNHERE